MGQVPAKYFYPPAPYGSSLASNTVNQVNPAARNPQTPLLPTGFTDPGTTISGSQAASASTTPGPYGSSGGGAGGKSPWDWLFGGKNA
jgi:hypothetical protein